MLRHLLTKWLSQADEDEDDLPNVRLINGKTSRSMTLEAFARDETLGLSRLERCRIGAEIEDGFSVEMEDGRRFEPDGRMID